MEATRKPVPAHFSFIDTLRGSAALFVAFYHIFRELAAEKSEFVAKGFNHFVSNLIVGHFDLGKYAVGVFFLVSGFLIPATLEKSRSLRTFAIHRFFRLYPAYWFSILILAAVEVFLYGKLYFSRGDLLINLTMLQGFLKRPDISGVFWTLQIELTFYFTCVFLFCCGLLRHRGPLTIAFLIVALLGSFARWKLGKAVPEALFIALALMFAADGLRHHDRLAWIYFWLCAAFLVPISHFAYGSEGPRYLVTYWMALLSFWVVFRSNSLALHRSAVVVFMADISYSFYLLHGPIGITLSNYLGSHGLGLWPALLAGLLAAIFVSFLAYRFIEAPAIAFSHHLAPARRKAALVPAEV